MSPSVQVSASMFRPRRERVGAELRLRERTARAQSARGHMADIASRKTL